MGMFQSPQGRSQAPEGRGGEGPLRAVRGGARPVQVGDRGAPHQDGREGQGGGGGGGGTREDILFTILTKNGTKIRLPGAPREQAVVRRPAGGGLRLAEGGDGRAPRDPGFDSMPSSPKQKKSRFNLCR